MTRGTASPRNHSLETATRACTHGLTGQRLSPNRVWASSTTAALQKRARLGAMAPTYSVRCGEGVASALAVGLGEVEAPLGTSSPSRRDSRARLLQLLSLATSPATLLLAPSTSSSSSAVCNSSHPRVHVQTCYARIVCKSSPSEAQAGRCMRL